MDKKKLIVIVVTAIIVSIGWFGIPKLLPQEISLSGSVAYHNQPIPMFGFSDNALSLPLEQSFTDSTTTNDVAHADPGGTLQQELKTDGVDEVELNILAIGGTVTSTMYIRQMGSFDGINYFNIATTSAPITTATTTKIGIVPRGTNLDPGLNTTTISLPFSTRGHAWTRFIIHADNIATDPNDGVQAWITAQLIQPF